MTGKYVVTGGAGFIGSALVRGLLKAGASEVAVIDNLLTGHEKNLAEVRDRDAADGVSHLSLEPGRRRQSAHRHLFRRSR